MLTSPGSRRERLAQPEQHVAVELEDVPVQPVGHPDRIVREAVHLLQPQLVRADPAEHHPAAGGSKIHRRHHSRLVSVDGRYSARGR